MSHRRTAVKQKRIRQVRRQIALICSALVILIAGVLYFVLKPEDKQEKADKDQIENQIADSEIKKPEVNEEENVSEEVQKEEKEEVPQESTEKKDETEEARLERVKKEAEEAGYPKKVIELLDKNPETVDYVEAYGEKKDIESPEIIEEFKKGEVPRLIQWDERWGYASYGTGIMAVCGCGPTCLSMVVSALNEDNTLTPVKLARYGTKHGYVTEENDTMWSFMTDACENWGVQCRDEFLDEEGTLKALDKGRIIVCSVGPGDFTQKGHFILLAGHEEGDITVHDPFSIKNSERTWTYDELKDQIKVMWIYSKQ